MSKIPKYNGSISFDNKNLIESIKKIKGDKFLVISSRKDKNISDSKVVLDLETFIEIINDLGLYKDTVKKILEENGMSTKGLD